MKPLSLFFLVLSAVIITIPFGVWRARTRKFSVAWFLAIHLPIPGIFLLRIEFGFSYWYVPLLILASVAGQIIGSRLVQPVRTGKQPAAS